MATRQPTWKLLTNPGDVNPIEYGGYFVYEDTTGVYPAEVEVLVAHPRDDSPEGWTIYRFALDRCQLIEDPDTHTIYLVPFTYNPPWPHALSKYDEWFHKDLANVASSIGSTLTELRQDLCSADPRDRAHAYRAIGEYHGFENLDGYPLTFHNRADVEARYQEVE